VGGGGKKGRRGPPSALPLATGLSRDKGGEKKGRGEGERGGKEKSEKSFQPSMCGGGRREKGWGDALTDIAD